MNRVAIHQPNYLPWPGYFLKLMVCDTFIYLDDVQFSKGSFTNRVEFTTPNNQLAFLTIPVSKDAYRFNICEVALKDNNWKLSHQQRLYSWLNSYPHFGSLSIVLEQYDRPELVSLAAFNINLIELLMREFEIECDRLKSSELNSQFRSTQRIVDLVQRSGGDTYIAGSGFVKYFQSEQWPDSLTCETIDFGKAIKNSELSPNSLIESIARFGLEKTRTILQQLANILTS